MGDRVFLLVGGQGRRGSYLIAEVRERGKYTLSTEMGDVAEGGRVVEEEDFVKA